MNPGWPVILLSFHVKYGAVDQVLYWKNLIASGKFLLETIELLIVSYNQRNSKTISEFK